METTIYINGFGMETGFILRLDALAHQRSALSHLAALVDMCLIHVDGNPEQVEAQASLLRHKKELTQLQKLAALESQGESAFVPLPCIMSESNHPENAAPEGLARLDFGDRAQGESGEEVGQRAPRRSHRLTSIRGGEVDTPEERSTSRAASRAVSTPGESGTPESPQIQTSATPADKSSDRAAAPGADVLASAGEPRPPATPAKRLTSMLTRMRLRRQTAANEQ
eukprot:gb/GFBE01076957.1/.p1 GENE.gb/GFBE01076957.1/~~gb/GFBE01076957.1/.p1  ORF type:complete len:225 (+),score=37.78 gb/GFBE01076957.1/:1-675(+)